MIYEGDLLRAIEKQRKEFEYKSDGASSDWLNGVIYGIMLVKGLVKDMKRTRADRLRNLDHVRHFFHGTATR